MTSPQHPDGMISVYYRHESRFLRAMKKRILETDRSQEKMAKKISVRGEYKHLRHVRMSWWQSRRDLCLEKNISCYVEFIDKHWIETCGG